MPNRSRTEPSASRATQDPNFDTYIDPINYDLESGRFELEGTILLELAREASGPVLELGSGTGRVTIPLAQQGVDMTGLELLPHMIRHAQSKSAGLPIQWVCDDVRHFQLDARYALIFTVGAVFQHLLERADQEAMLSRVRQHLAPDGRFIIDLGFKHPKEMADVLDEKDWFTYTDDQGREVTVSGTDQFNHLQQIWHQTYYRRWPGASDEQNDRPIKLSLRYFMPQEMESLLAYNGFKVQSRYGDWQGSPLAEDGYQQIYVCELRR